MVSKHASLSPAERLPECDGLCEQVRCSEMPAGEQRERWVDRARFIPLYRAV